MNTESVGYDEYIRRLQEEWAYVLRLVDAIGPKRLMRMWRDDQ